MTYQRIENDTLKGITEGILVQHGVHHNYNERSGGGTTRVMEWTLQDERFKTLFKGDICYPTVTIINSNNKETALRLKVGVFRLICSNGLTIGDEWLSHKIVHRTGKTVEQKLDWFMEDLNDLIEYLSKGDYMDELAQEVTTPLWEVDRMYQLAGSLRLPNKTKDELFYMIENPPRERDNIIDLWTFYNNVNEAIDRTVKRDSPARERYNKELLEDIIELAKVV